MASKVLMEALSPTMEEGRLVEWKKNEGDPIRIGDVIAEVETDKAVMELVARAEGVLLKQLVPAGSTVAVAKLVGIVGQSGEDITALLAIDQVVNSAAKMRYMSGGQVGCPIVFRGPGGSALQLAAQHSQSFESWYAHIPGLKVLTPGTPADAKGLLKSAIRDDDPVVFIEGEMLYNVKGEVPDGEHLVPIGKAEVKRAGADVTLVCHSKTVTVALKAADLLAEEGISAEVVDLRTIRPLDTDTILNSVGRTHRCVVVEEGWVFAGVGAQVVDVIQQHVFDELDAPVLRVTGADVPMPYNKQLERASKADPAKVVAAVKRVLYLA